MAALGMRCIRGGVVVAAGWSGAAQEAAAGAASALRLLRRGAAARVSLCAPALLGGPRHSKGRSKRSRPDIRQSMIAACARASSRRLPALAQRGGRLGEVPALSRAYHQNIVDHYENPRNVGSFDKKDPNVGTGLVGAPACGDVMKLQIKARAPGAP